MKLRIQDGILLKEYHLAWMPGGWSNRPPGWTPDDTNEWVSQQVETHLQPALDAQALDGPALENLRAALRPHIAEAYGKVLHEQRKPWPGWVPVLAQMERRLVEAYRDLVADLNPDTRPASWVVWPRDGLYELRSGRIVPLE